MISLKVPQVADLKPRIAVIGVGGAGGNAINNMILGGLDGVDYIVANTDAQALLASSAERRIQLGASLTEGLGAGAKPERGEAAAEEARDEIKGQLTGCHMAFIAAGMGGGTGTGAAPVIARIARELGILTVAIVTKPFQFEGSNRMRMAEAGIERMRHEVDTLIVIPNHNLFKLANERTGFREAFVMADQVLFSGIACIVDLIVKDGLINLDLADVKTVLTGMGTAMMGTGERKGEKRALLAAEDAIMNPLLEEIDLSTARGLIISIIGGEDLTLHEVDVAANRIRSEVAADANIIVGTALDPEIKDGSIRVSIVASGMTQRERAAQALSQGLAAGYMTLPTPSGHTMASVPALAPTPAHAKDLDRTRQSSPDALSALDRSPWSDMIGQPYGAQPPQLAQQVAETLHPQNAGGDGTYLGMQDHRQFDQVFHPDHSGTQPHAAQLPAREIWQGPDAVSIEERPLRLYETPEPGPGAHAHAGGGNTAQSASFTPHQTIEIKKSNRRGAEVNDFSPHAQSVYRSQQPQPAEHEAPRRAGPAASTNAPGLGQAQPSTNTNSTAPDLSIEDRRKGSLLWRITAGGFGRR